ncbi:MAG: DUF1800 domain-containing protein [Bacteroidota bacterium]|nr:DUF1800 domain-containing protein [Bacteroidota bacterium]
MVFNATQREIGEWAAPQAAGVVKPLGSAPQRASTLDLTPYETPLDFQHAAHLLRRTMFGPTFAEIQAAVGTTAAAAIDKLLSATVLPSPPVDYNQNDAMFNQVWVQQPYDKNQETSWRLSLKAWWLGLMISQGVSLREKMALFWHNHFSCATETVGDACYMYAYNNLLRQYALGNFKTLVKQITINPAMLRYLNGNTNTKASPNENYGRELQELFTIGKGPEIAPGDYTNYTEDDVKAAARVLTGWRDNRAQITSYFDATRHDTGDKQFSAHYQNQIINGRTGAEGANETDDLITMIFNQNETARYICRKLYRWFVYSSIDDSIEQNIIAPLAGTLKANSFEIAPVLKQLLTSQHFFDNSDTGFMGATIKCPADFYAGVVRSLQMSLPADTVAVYSLLNYIRNQMAANGMDILDTPDVSGWKAYYQDPDFYQLWINTSTLPQRSNFTSAVVRANGVSTSTFQLVADPIAYAETMPAPSDPNELLKDFARHLFAMPLSDSQIAYLKQVLLNDLPDYEWTNQWNAYVSDPSNVNNRNAIRDKLLNLLRAMLRMAEYQVM